MKINAHVDFTELNFNLGSKKDNLMSQLPNNTCRNSQLNFPFSKKFV